MFLFMHAILKQKSSSFQYYYFFKNQIKIEFENIVFKKLLFKHKDDIFTIASAITGGEDSDC